MAPSVEDSPHYLVLFKEYANILITLTVSLLGFSVAFVEKLSPPDASIWQKSSLAAAWAFTFVALLAGICIIANLTAVSSNYMRAYRIANPDPLTTSLQPAPANNPSLTQDQKDTITASLAQSSKRTLAVSWWADLSFWMIGLAAIAILSLGISSLLPKKDVSISSIIDGCFQTLEKSYSLQKKDLKLKLIDIDSVGHTLTAEFQNANAANELITLKINADNGKLIKLTRSP